MIFFFSASRLLEQFERVAVAFRHFFAIDARHAGGSVDHPGLRQHEDLAEDRVERARQIAADFDVLHLILADGHDVRVVRQNVGRLQHGIGEQAGVGTDPLGDFVLVGHAAREQAHRRAGHQQPIKFGDLGHVGLHEERRAVGIEPQGQQIGGGVERVLPKLLAVADRRQGVQVGDEIKRLLGLILQFDVLPNRAEIVAPVKTTCRLNAGENSHG